MHRPRSTSNSNAKTTSFQNDGKMNRIQKAEINVEHGTFEHREHIGFDRNGKLKVNLDLY
jgi:hypothetical protein